MRASSQRISLQSLFEAGDYRANFLINVLREVSFSGRAILEHCLVTAYFIIVKIATLLKILSDFYLLTT